MGSMWSPAIGRVAGITIRLHLFFLIYVGVELLTSLPRGGAVVQYVAIFLAVLFGSVLLHEFGHCFAARRVGGRADEILIWPLGGLAYADVPPVPRAEFLMVAAGPAVNLVLAALFGGYLHATGAYPSLFTNPFLVSDWMGIAYGLNLVMLGFNLIPAYPLDGGRMLRAALWSRWGARRSAWAAAQVGMVAAVGVGIWGLVSTNFLMVGVAIFMYVSCQQERMRLQEGMDEAGEFGFEVGQYYRRDEEEVVRVKERKPSLFDRLSRRFRRRRPSPPRERTAAEVRQRVDSLLDKISKDGMASLNDEERQFLRDASEFFRD